MAWKRCYFCNQILPSHDEECPERILHLMTKAPTSLMRSRADRMAIAMEIACQAHESYGESLRPGFIGLRNERRIPFDDPVFQAAYATLCWVDMAPNQYLTLRPEGTLAAD